MVKGEDAIRRKKNKLARKKLGRKESVSARVAAIIATKKRRKSGKRRVSEAMCFGLPTADDPFRDRFNGKNDVDSVEDDVLTARAKSRLKKILKDEDDDAEDKMSLRDKSKKDKKKKKSGGKSVDMEGNEVGKKRKSVGSEKLVNVKNNLIHPSEVLFLCLNTIQDALKNEKGYDSDKDEDADMPFFASRWGIEFLEGYSAGNDLLVVGAEIFSVKQIAWIVSVAADNIQKMETKGIPTSTPFMLFIVPSQARAVEVRSVCKPLKDMGLHTVSVHPSVSIEHQIHGLKSCEPEFIVSTPERLLELVSLKAIDISTVSLMIVDKLETDSRESQLGTIKSIRARISGEPITVVYDDNQTAVSDGQSILRESFLTLTIDGPVKTMHTSHEEDKHMKLGRPSKKGKAKKEKESCHCC